MKRILSTLFLITLIFLSCQKENENTSKKKSSLKDYESIGKQHNQGLEIIYNDLENLVKKSNKKLDKLSRKEIKSAIDETTFQYASDLHKKNSEHLDFSIKTYKFSTSLLSNINDAKSKNGSSYLDSVITLLDLTPKQREILNQVSKLFDNSTNYDEIKIGLNQLVARVDEEIETDEEAAILYTALSIANNSLEYWNQNINEWIQLYSVDANKGWFSGTGVVKADIAGGISGGLVGAISGGTASLGTLTVPGWVAGAVIGGVGSSAYDAVDQILDHYF